MLEENLTKRKNSEDLTENIRKQQIQPILESSFTKKLENMSLDSDATKLSKIYFFFSRKWNFKRVDLKF